MPFVFVLLSLTETCGEDSIHLSPGIAINLTSTNFPENYPNGENCQWKITTEDSSKLVIEFMFFDLESRYDYLYIGDSPDKESASLVLSGSQGPEYAVSDGSVHWFIFTTDIYVTRKGFALKLSWENASGRWYS